MIAGKKFPLSIGIKEAKHEIVLLTDADCVPASEHWMFKMQDAFSNGVEVALGYGAYTKMPGLLNKIIRFETFHSALQYLSYALAGSTYMGVGRNLSYKKDLKEQDEFEWVQTSELGTYGPGLWVLSPQSRLQEKLNRKRIK